MRLGHPHDQVLHVLFSKFKYVSNKCTNFDYSCTDCLYGKMHKLHFPKSQFTASSPFKLSHSYLWGPTPVTSMNGFKYYVLFIDHFTRFTWLYLPQSKSEVFDKFVHFKNLIEISSLPKLRPSGLMEEGNTHLPLSNLTYLIMVSYIRFHVHTISSKMA